MTYHTFSGSQVWTHTLILHYVCVSKYNVNAECLIEQSRRQRGSASSGRSPQSLWRVSNRGITSARKLPPTIAHWQLNIWNIPIGTLFFILQGCFRWLIIRHTHTHHHGFKLSKINCSKYCKYTIYATLDSEERDEWMKVDETFAHKWAVEG